MGIYLPKFTVRTVSTNKRNGLEEEMCEAEAKESVAVKEIHQIEAMFFTQGQQQRYCQSILEIGWTRPITGSDPWKFQFTGNNLL